MFSHSFWKSDRDRPYFKRREIVNRCFVTYRVSLLIFDNLLRLRLIESDLGQFSSMSDSGPDATSESLQIRLSEFGVEFVRQSRLA